MNYRLQLKTSAHQLFICKTNVNRLCVVIRRSLGRRWQAGS